MLISEVNDDKQSINLDSSYFYGPCGSRDVLPRSKEVLRLIVDEACLLACEYLYDLNIRTMNCSANKQAVKSCFAYITVDYKTLDANNRNVIIDLLDKERVILHLDDDGNIITFDVVVSIDDSSTVEEVSQEFLDIVKNFHKQRIMYGCYSSEEMEDIAISALNSNCYCAKEGVHLSTALVNRIKNGEIEVHEDGIVEITDMGVSIDIKSVVDLIVADRDYWYDEDENRYWVDKELFDKYKSELEVNKNRR